MSPRPDLGPKPRLGYTDSRLERVAEARPDDVAIAAYSADAQARTYVVGGEMIVMKKSERANDPLFSMAEARAFGPPTEMIFLGLMDGAARFGVGIEPKAAEALKEKPELLITDLRSIAVKGLVEADHLPPIAEAKALLHWHARHRFCPACGQPTRPVHAGWRRDCPTCETQHFPRTDPVAIMLAVDGDNCLLGRSPRFAPTMWSCLAGFVEPGESIEDAVRRETREESGIVCGRVVYFASQAWPFPTSLMVGCHAEAKTREIVVDRSELEDARWFSKGEVESMLMRRHVNGLTTPPPVAIAHHIIRAWIEDEVSFD
ncbi:MAG TPA: NAD(+) diphosphatase [Pseudolabrys sp.]|nr:NAD(+) diphosphatase [Pseudolabrys sp.]